MKKIFCFGDGFATGDIWPEWPQILQALVPDYQVVVTAGLGAGTEFLVSGFVDLIDSMQDSIVIFQWPWFKRFDKLLVDQSWQGIIANDPVYDFNTNTDAHNRKWWLSSGSKIQDIKHYHNHYVQEHQHWHRQEMYQTLVSQTAENLNCQLIHTSTELQETFSQSPRFASTRQQQIQPSPIVHFYWLIEQIIPQTSIVTDNATVARLETLITQTTWTPYNPDRVQIWADTIVQLNNTAASSGM